MKYGSIDFTNVGPIEDGTVHRDKLSVLIGPNNSGKTIAAKIIHGVCQMDERQDRPQVPSGVTMPSDRESVEALSSIVDTMMLIQHAGLRPDSAAMQGKKTSLIAVHGKDGSEREFNLATAKGNQLAFNISLAGANGLDKVGRSMYLPATRAGSTQYLLATMRLLVKMTQMQSNLLSQVISAFKVEKEKASNITPSILPDDVLIDPSLGDLTRYIGPVLETMVNGLTKESQETFSKLFPGSINIMERSGAPLITYDDPSGHQAEITSVGSGVVSLLPIVAGIHRVEAEGTCVIEEPESHLEPQKQLVLMDEILRIANEKRVSMVVTTQSDFLVQKVLSLVSSGSLDRSDLGLYYLRRPADSLTRIEKLHVEKTGEAEQEMFTRAMDSLIKGF